MKNLFFYKNLYFISFNSLMNNIVNNQHVSKAILHRTTTIKHFKTTLIKLQTRVVPFRGFYFDLSIFILYIVVISVVFTLTKGRMLKILPKVHN